MEEKNKATTPENAKSKDLKPETSEALNEFNTTNTGVKINNDQDSLKAGDRGPSLLEDFIMREKLTHFDHERIPERVVHARGTGAHGVFQVYESLAHLTKAEFLHDPTALTPVFVRFSTVVGSRGSSDLARDARGFAAKFYTNQGNFDLVGNNIPVFFIQDAMKFPDLVHAVKPEPNNEIPQATGAHDTFWDFISLMPESTHMIMWLMSDRAIPRSYRMMEGFGVHTFRFINDKGVSHFVKFHWKPLLGVHAVAWDEAQKISGQDPDFHRRDLWQAIDSGSFPEFELGIQVVPEEDEHRFGFDLLDSTKIIPEELVPVQRVGKLTLNRNPDNFFAETEQSAFHVGHVVPGIDFTNDPLLQGRLFSYTDTQLIRLGGPNFQEIPINRPIATVHNNQRDGFMRQTINRGKVSYEPNSLADGFPKQATEAQGGFTSYPDPTGPTKTRGRSKSFFDHFSQANMFYNSQSEAEKKHIIDAFSFELGKVESVAIQKRMVGILTQVDRTLAAAVAEALGVPVPEGPEYPMNHNVPADGNVDDYQPINAEPPVPRSEALSMQNTVKNTIATRKIAVLAADGVDEEALNAMKLALEEGGAMTEVIAPRHGAVRASNGSEISVKFSFLTSSSVLYDAVYIAGGNDSVATLAAMPDAIHFVNEAYRHCKAIAAEVDARPLLERTYFGSDLDTLPGLAGVFMESDRDQLSALFKQGIAGHRYWEREKTRKVPA